MNATTINPATLALDERTPPASDVVSTVGDGAGATSDAVRRALTGIRLGQHERRILLLAPSYASGGELGEGALIGPAAPGRSAAEAHRRAVRRLAHAALIYAMREDVPQAVPRPTRIPLAWVGGHENRPSGRGGPTTLVSLASNQRYWHTAVLLTPLGAAVVDVVRPDIDTGRAIRWADRAGAIAEKLPHHEAAEGAAWARSDARLSAFTAAWGQVARERVQGS